MTIPVKSFFLFVCLFVLLLSVVRFNRQENDRARLHKPETHGITGWTAQLAAGIFDRAVHSAGAEGAAAPARKTQFVSNITLITRKSTN